MPPSFAAEVIAFVLGCVFGSFLNVCIARLPRHRSVVSPDSACEACGHPVRALDNIPLVSYLALKGRCRDCGASIGVVHLAVEAMTGLLFAFALRIVFLQATGPDAAAAGATTTAILNGAMLAVFGFLLLGLAVMDWQTQRLPDAFTFTGIAAGFLLVCVRAVLLPTGAGDVRLNTTHQLRMSSPGSMASQGNVFLTGPESLVFGRIAAICGAALLLWLVGRVYFLFRKRHGMGAGDIKLAAMIAAFLGFWPAMLALFFALIFALPYALYLLARREAGGRTPLPFGSFLCAGALVAALAGDPLLTWYRGLL